MGVLSVLSQISGLKRESTPMHQLPNYQLVISTN